MAERNSRAEPPRPIHTPPMPDPKRRIDALVDALIFGRIGAADGTRRLANVLARAKTASERRRLVGHFRAFMLERKSPYNAVGGIADVVNGYIDGRGAAFRLLPCPHWVTTNAQRRLYLFSLVAGFGGRTFGLAKNEVAPALGTYARAVEEFVRKAKLYGFLVELPRRQADARRWQHMTPYRLTNAHETELGTFQPLLLTAAERLAWIFRVPLSADEQERLADEVLSGCV